MRQRAEVWLTSGTTRTKENILKAENFAPGRGGAKWGMESSLACPFIKCETTHNTRRTAQSSAL
jgi:hypothetical protein